MKQARGNRLQAAGLFAAALVLLGSAAQAGAADVILLEFTASWCGPCRAMQPLVAKLKAEGVDVRVIDCSGGVPAKLRGWNVGGLPTFVACTPQWVEIGRQTGSCSEQRLRDLLNPKPQKPELREADGTIICQCESCEAARAGKGYAVYGKPEVLFRMEGSLGDVLKRLDDEGESP